MLALRQSMNYWNDILTNHFRRNYVSKLYEKVHNVYSFKGFWKNDTYLQQR